MKYLCVLIILLSFTSQVSAELQLSDSETSQIIDAIRMSESRIIGDINANIDAVTTQLKEINKTLEIINGDLEITISTLESTNVSLTKIGTDLEKIDHSLKGVLIFMGVIFILVLLFKFFKNRLKELL